MLRHAVRIRGRSEKRSEFSSLHNMPAEVVTMTNVYSGSGGRGDGLRRTACELRAAFSRAVCDREPRAIASHVRSRAVCERKPHASASRVHAPCQARGEPARIGRTDVVVHCMFDCIM